MKKGLVLFLACFMILVLSACESGEHIPLTPEESDAIAQYSAYLIMKHDARKTHKEKLLDEKQLQEEYEERAAAEAEENPKKEDTTTPEPTKAVAPEKTDKVDPVSEVVTPEPTATPVPKPEFGSLSECYDNKFEVLFSKCIIGESYVNDSEVFNLTAHEGKKFVVLEFTINNNSSQKMTFDSTKFNVSYKLISEKRTNKPKTTLVANEISLFKKDFEPKESTSGVLIFEIDKDDTPKTVVVTNPDISPDKTYEITINN